MAALGWFLKIRGWTIRHIGLHPDPFGTAVGIGVAIATQFAAWVVFVVLAIIGLDGFDVANYWSRESRFGLAIIVAICTVNSVFEEVFVSGYVITLLKARFTTWMAIHVSVAIRLSYHLYQGGMSVVGIIPTGFIFAYWYARTGQLWPLIVAHGVLNLWALAPYAQ